MSRCMSDGPMEGHCRQWESTVGSKRATHTHTVQKKKKQQEIDRRVTLSRREAGKGRCGQWCQM